MSLYCFDDFTPELDAIQLAGWRILDRIVWDYGETLGVLVEKDGQRSRVMLRECFYDTDNQGNRTQFHGVVDIRQSGWSKNLRAALARHPRH